MKSSSRSRSLALLHRQAAVRRQLSRLTRLASVRAAAIAYIVFVLQPIASIWVFTCSLVVRVVCLMLGVCARMCLLHARLFTHAVKLLLLRLMYGMLLLTKSHCLRLQQQAPVVLVFCRLAWQTSFIVSDAGALQAHQGGAAVSRQTGAPAHAAGAASVCPASLRR